MLVIDHAWNCALRIPRSLASKKIIMRSYAGKHNQSAIFLIFFNSINQNEIASNMALPIAIPVAYQSMIAPFGT